MRTALDTNVLVHLLVSSSSGHVRCAAWLEAFSGVLATTLTNVAEFLRLVTHPRVFARPMSLTAAVALLDEFAEEFDVEILDEANDWWQRLVDDYGGLELRGNDVFDARIAACLKYHGVGRICTLDSDFRKYADLEVIVP